MKLKQFMLSSCLLLSVNAYSDLRPIEEDKWFVSLGAYAIQRSDSSISLGKNTEIGGVGVAINLQDDLNVERQYKGGRLEAYRRFGKRHRLELSVYEFNRNGSKTINEEIEFENSDGETVTFGVGSKIDSEFNIGVNRLSYIYSFYRSNKVELGVGGGLYGMDLSLKLEGLAQVGGNPETVINESGSQLVPLPVFSFRMDYAPWQRWMLKFHTDQFFIGQDGIKGEFNDLRLVAEHQTFKHVSFGFGINRTSLQAEVKDEYFGEVDTYWTGVMAYVAGRF